MAQLHELLAVEGDLEKGYRETLNSAEKVFKDKAHLFTGYHKRLELFKDDDSIDTPEEHLEISATVIGKLDDAFDVEVL